MTKKFIATTAMIMVLTSSIAFAANHTMNTGSTTQNGYSHQNENYQQHGQHMYQLTNKGKGTSNSVWDSVCNFFGTHGGHNSHGGHSWWGGNNHGGRHM